MADRAYLINDDGSTRLVRAEELDDKMCCKSFRCAGVVKIGKDIGSCCDAVMTTHYVEKRGGYYFSAIPSSKHKKGCEFDETNPVKRCLHLDRVCKGYNMNELLDAMEGSNMEVKKMTCPCCGKSIEIPLRKYSVGYVGYRSGEGKRAPQWN